jgi:signal transduction histidine kinase
MNGGLSGFFDQHFITIYFLYGLSFFSMGLALLVESRQQSELPLARSVHLLGIFGLLHGSHEFFEMLMLAGDLSQTLWVDIVRAVLLPASFFPLLAFGFTLLPRAQTTPGYAARLTLLAFFAYILQIALLYITYRPTFHDWLRGTDAISRYILAIPGAALVGAGMLRQRRSLQSLGMHGFGRDLAIASVALATYGIVGQMFPPQTIIFPSMYVNSALFYEAFGFPVQVLRGLLALITAVGIIRALRAFAEETRRRLQAASETERGLQTAARELSLLYEASSLLTSTYELDTLTQKAVDRIVRLIEPISFSAIYVPATSLGQAEHLSTCGYSAEARKEIHDLLVSYVSFARHLAGANQSLEQFSYWVDKDGRDVSHEVSSHLQTREPLASLPIRRVALPLETQEHVVGSLLLETTPEGPYLSSLEAPTIIAMGRQLAVAIENVQLVLQLRRRGALQTELLQRVTQAQEAERKRIARELHDDTGQALTALALGLRGVSKLLVRQPEVASTQVEQLQQISTTALEELRHMISDLRPSHLDDLGLVAALRWYVEHINQRSPTQVSLKIAGQPYRLQPETETTLFRIAQEGLGNVLKHAEAQHTKVELAFEPELIRLAIEDDGKGFDTTGIMEPSAGRAWGLIGIQERAVLAGGRLSIDSAPGQGTCITVWVPVMPSIADPADS